LFVLNDLDVIPFDSVCRVKFAEKGWILPVGEENRATQEYVVVRAASWFPRLADSAGHLFSAHRSSRGQGSKFEPDCKYLLRVSKILLGKDGR
jgi:hypothetical protein